MISLKRSPNADTIHKVRQNGRPVQIKKCSRGHIFSTSNNITRKLWNFIRNSAHVRIKWKVLAESHTKQLEVSNFLKLLSMGCRNLETYDLVICITEHLEKFKGRLLRTVHWKMLWMSCWRMLWSCSLQMGRTIEWSSANCKSWEDTTSLMSLTKSRNNIGPRTEPWGTPEVTIHHSEREPLKITHCWRIKRKFCIHCRSEPLKPKEWSLLSKRLWSTLSKAELKSKNTPSTRLQLRLSSDLLRKWKNWKASAHNFYLHENQTDH